MYPNNLLKKSLLIIISMRDFRKSRLKLRLSIPEVDCLYNVTKSVISGYECNRYNPTKEVLIFLSSKFDMDYLCMAGYQNLYIILMCFWRS